MTARFLAALPFVLKWECAYAPGHDGDLDHVIAEHVPNDPGGTTKYGIDEQAHPDLDIENLTLDQARGIYFSHYWGPSHAEDLPIGMGEACFDAAVNTGTGHAVIWLQQALQSEGLYHDNIDGNIGPVTLAAAKTSNPMTAALGMIAKREAYYHYLAIHRPSLERFVTGWLNRTADLTAYVHQLIGPISPPR